MANYTLVIFKDELPDRSKKWWLQFDTVIAPKRLKNSISNKINFVDLEDLLEPGNIYEAERFARELSLINNREGKRISKSVNYKGFELWWIHYNDLMHRFCLPYTQYKRLLNHLLNYKKVFLYEPPFPALFGDFLESYASKYEMFDKFSKKSPSVGMWFQIILSLLFLPWLFLKQAKIIVWTSDQFDSKADYDFRMRYIYKELRNRKVPFVEFIRSMEPSKTILGHALTRKRPVIYSYAIVNILYFLADLFTKPKHLKPSQDLTPKEQFWFTVSAKYLKNIRGTIWSIKVLKWMLKVIGIRSAIIDAGSSRTLHEIIACKLLGIPVTGIQHGASLKQYNVSDYMPEFDGEKTLGVDKYGVWSKWWKEYHIKNSRVYKEENLFVAGPMRPIDKIVPIQEKSIGKTKVLLVSEELAAPEEVIPYLESLISDNTISLYIKFRFYRDGFEDWLKENRKDLLDKIDKEKIIKDSMHEAVAKCDVVIGCRSNGVIEALLQLKPFVFFQTNKWGDYFELKSFDSPYKFFAENPEELQDLIGRSKDIPDGVLKELQNRFFGDPYQNGSKWVVEEALKSL